LAFLRQAQLLATMPVRRAAMPVASVTGRSPHQPPAARRTSRSG
jgi:hypothetical protein